MFAVLAILGALVSFDSIAGQTDGAVESVEETALPYGHVTVVGDGLMSGAAVAPLRPGPCSVSERSPMALAVRSDSAVTHVDNLACRGASLSTMSREQIPLIDPTTQLVVVGGLAPEFDWAELSAACLDPSSHSAFSCSTTAQIARATAANSFFSWRSLLEQIARTAPDAAIAIVGPPMPVSRAPKLLGSPCCSDRIDAHERVRSTFETASASRTAVVDSMEELNIVHIDLNDAFAQHRANDDDPWIIAPGDVDGLAGLANLAGTIAAADALRPIVPNPMEAPEAPRALHETALLVARQLAEDEIAIPDWFLAHESVLADLAVAVVGIDERDVVEVDPEDPNAPHVVIDGPPLEFLFLEGPEAVAATLAAPELESEATSVTGLVDAIDRAAELAWTPGSVRNLVIVLEAIEFDELEAAQILVAEALARVEDAAIRVLVPDAGSIEDLTPLFPEIADLLAALDTPDALPVPAPRPAVVDVVVPSVIASTAGEPTSLRAAVVSEHAVQVSVDWFLEDELIAAGQVATIEPGVVPPGVHEIAVRASDAALSVEHPLQLIISSDGDGTGDEDSCPSTFDPSLTDTDGDGTGDACDDDDDGDLIPDDLDPCQRRTDRRFVDADLDGRPDHCDGDRLDGPAADFDSDDVPDAVDNCPNTTNRNQADLDDDGIGDECDDGLDVRCTIIGTAGDDRLVGTPEADVICGLAGDDVLLGVGGNDVLYGGAGNDVMRGGPGSDRIVGSSGEDHLFGATGDDILIGGTGADRLDGGEGDDILGGAGGRDRLESGVGDDLLVGGPAADRLFGGMGNDVMRGDQGPDALLGNEGDDLLDGGGGADELYGGEGDDRLIDVSESDRAIPGAGRDLVGAGRPTIG